MVKCKTLLRWNCNPPQHESYIKPLTTNPRVPRVNNEDFDEEDYWTEGLSTLLCLYGKQARERFKSWMYDGETVSESAHLRLVQPEVSDLEGD